MADAVKPTVLKAHSQTAGPSAMELLASILPPFSPTTKSIGFSGAGPRVARADLAHINDFRALLVDTA